MKLRDVVLAVAGVLVLSGVAFSAGVLVGRAPVTVAVMDDASAASSSADAAKREFMFQVPGYQTENQGGQTLNIFIHYRYNTGIATADIPNYEDLRTETIEFLDAVDVAQEPYWETLNQEICSQLKAGFPLEAISCQFQVLPDDRSGLPYEPGYHTSIHTIGDIEPLAVTGPIPGDPVMDAGDP
jgi:hypothetical protein